MLRTPADFPHAGSEAFLATTAQKARIVRDNGDGTALIALVATRGDPAIARIASGNRTIPTAELFATEAEALKGKRARRRKAA